ncbi:MAG: hypothetical protein IPK81_12460 [Rhodospirillales bacterium]|nr:MAG: hypothetical protein IPK81_12460 [Rhodospirillales bacterium]
MCDFAESTSGGPERANRHALLTGGAGGRDERLVYRRGADRLGNGLKVDMAQRLAEGPGDAPRAAAAPVSAG